MTTITHAQLAKMLLALKPGATFAGATLDKAAKLKKRGNPPSGIRQVTRLGTTILHFDYQANVRAQQQREDAEPDFVAKAPQWGTRVGETCLVRHTPQGEDDEVLYVDLRPLGDGETRYYNAAGDVPRSDIEQFLPPKSKSHSRQGVEKTIRVRRPRVAHVAQINIGGEQYRVTG